MMPNPDPSPKEMMMPLEHAHDALGDCVSRFHNEMLRRGIKQLPSRKWVEEFRSFLDACEFERDYREISEFLAKRSGNNA